jgi:dihydrofolate synthase / folylpolyglutamate synthase
MAMTDRAWARCNGEAALISAQAFPAALKRPCSTLPITPTLGKVQPGQSSGLHDSIGWLRMMSRQETPEPPRFTELQQAYAWLDAHINYERLLDRVAYGESTFNLSPFRALMDRLGAPHRGIPTVHIAGTRGKGSSALALEAILTAVGFRVATFTSPHIREYRERIRVGGAPLDAVSFQRCLELAAAARLGGQPEGETSFKTVFELLTAVFFLAAKREGADFLVVETGLGGRLDTTNILDPGPVLLTRIGLEHTHLLGDTLEAIAAEKAAILKSGGWGVWTNQADSAAPAVFERRSRDVAAPLSRAAAIVPLLDEEYHGHGMKLTYDLRGEALQLDLPLYGPFLAENFQGVLAIVHELVERGVAPPISSGLLGRELSALQLPGRMQRVAIPDRPDVSVFLDGAHCPTGAAAVAGAMRAHFGQSPGLAVVTMMADKDATGFFRALAAWPQCHGIVCSTLNFPRAASAEALAVAAREHFTDVRVCPNLPKALELALKRCESGGTMVAMGSIFAVAPALDWSLHHGGA